MAACYRTAQIDELSIFYRAEAYRCDVPGAQIHVLNAAHFALDTAADEIAALVRRPCFA